ncbi:hypothetical protein J2X65_002034 [Ancylobacter sp. 3268]|uniref:Gp37 family protein n=1 Tax=Ancylobacter sp. 3268 TaxID=2817752 RepID=UPI0028566498|nr:Gp37 family protein [Ancylobacter sp. 3268]MDR6952675.1 hypothetical protein [Ancylobacter sp. 3268]
MTAPLTQQIEDAIVVRLKDRLPRAITRIEAFPDDPSQYDFPDRDAAACFVRYDSSSYAGQAGAPVQAYAPMRTLTFAISLLVRSMRRSDLGAVGAHDALDDIRLALQGQSFAGATAMVPISDQLEEQKGSVWRWGFRFSCKAPAVAAPDTGDRPAMMNRFSEAS